MTTYKDHSDAGRVANAHRAHPLMSGNVRESLSNNSKSPSLDHMLELGFRKEAINSKLRSPWNQPPPIDTSKDPYLGRSDTYKRPLPKEISPEHKSAIECRRKLFFQSSSMRTHEATIEQQLFKVKSDSKERVAWERSESSI